ncbi:hypothetical protein HW555_003078, partial [Spodoptera exigua]
YQKIIKENIRTYLSQPSRSIKEVVEALNNPAIVKKYIRFPQNIQERQMLKTSNVSPLILFVTVDHVTVNYMFYEKFGFPTLGCIDGTLVAMKIPAENEERFYYLKG